MALSHWIDETQKQSVLATLQSGAKLSRRNKQVDIIGTNLGVGAPLKQCKKKHKKIAAVVKESQTSDIVKR